MSPRTSHLQKADCPRAVPKSYHEELSPGVPEPMEQQQQDISNKQLYCQEPNSK